MLISVNGEKLTLEKSLNIDELLIVAKAEQPEYVSVQLNGKFIERDKFATTFINDGDEIEFLYFMGGGQIGTAD